MSKKITSFVSLFLILIMAVVSPMTTIYPSATEEMVEVEVGKEDTSSDAFENVDPTGGIESVTVEEVQEKIEGKAYALVALLQTIGKPICVIGFIIAILVSLFGALGKKGPVGGLIGAFIAAAAYVCINYAPEIVLFFQTYMTT